MSKKNKNYTKSKLIPELRFPEFKDKPQWEVKELGEVTTNESSALIQGALNFVDEGYPVYGADGIVGNIDFYHQEEPYISIVKDGSGVGRIGLHPAKSSVAGTLTYIKPTDKTLYSLDFLYYLLHKIPFSLYKVGSTIPHVYYSDYKLENLPLPSLAEQERIGEFFSVLDSLIQAQSKEVQLLRLRKKGLMQKMFPYEGETTPEWRFPEFKDAPEWEVKELGEVFSFLTTNSLSRACLNYETGSIKNIHYGDIHTKFRSLFNINIEEVPYINDDITINNPNFCQVGDIIFADASEDLIDVGKTIEITDTNNELLVSGLHTIMARPSKGTFSKGFAAFLFQSNRIKQAIKFTAQGTKVYGITANSIKSIPLPLPSLAEQERIGALFSTLDSLIEAKSQRLEQLKNHKKGLMQQLFP